MRLVYDTLVKGISSHQQFITVNVTGLRENRKDALVRFMGLHGYGFKEERDELSGNIIYNFIIARRSLLEE